MIVTLIMRNLLKRSTTFFAGQMVSKIATTIIYIWLARLISPSEYGLVFLFGLLIVINSHVFDIGLGQWYQKHVTDETREKLFEKVVTLKIYLGILGNVLCASYLHYVTHDPLFVLLFVVASMIDVIAGPVSVYYIERKNPLPPSISLLFKAIGTGVFIFLYRQHITIYSPVIGYISGSMLWLLIWFPSRKLPSLKLDIKRSIGILRESAAYSYLQITSFAYARADSLVIQQTLGAASLGIYGTAYRYLEAAAMFPNAIAQNLFHISAKEHIPQKQLLNLAAFTSLLGLLAAGATYVLSPFLITGLMGPAYADGIPILQILSIVVFLFFFNAPLATFIQSSSLLKKFLPFGIGNTILNIVLNVILIPLYGIQAAAWNMVLTEVLGGVINVYFVKKIYAEKGNN